MNKKSESLLFDQLYVIISVITAIITPIVGLVMEAPGSMTDEQSHTDRKS